MRRVPPVPYGRVEKRGGEWGKVCPDCGEFIVTRERKDFESFTGREYAEHFMAEHLKGATDG